MITTSRITSKDDLQQLVSDINAASWDDANDMVPYDAQALSTYLEQPDTLFVACYETEEGRKTLLGMASCRFEIKPYDASRWLYVDEVDVAADQRRKGAGSSIMKTLIDIADEADCDEVWLGTEVDNDAANGLYRSLKPSEIEEFVGYTWELED